MTKEQYEKLKEYMRAVAFYWYKLDERANDLMLQKEKELDKLMGFE